MPVESTIAVVVALGIVQEIIKLVREAQERGESDVDLSELPEIYQKEVAEPLAAWQAHRRGEGGDEGETE